MEFQNVTSHHSYSSEAGAEGSRLLQNALRDLRRSEEKTQELERSFAAKVAERTTFLNAIVDQLDEGICACDADGKVVLVNRATREYHAAQPLSTTGIVEGATVDATRLEGWQTRVETREPGTGEVIPEANLPLFRALQGESIRNVPLMTRKTSGEERYFSCDAQPLRTSSGALLGAVCILRDRTREQVADAKTKSLERKNIELQNFAAVAAHDLKSPLSSITQFVELLGSEYHGKLNEEADQILNFITDAGRRMSRMVDSLLLHARSGAAVKCRRKVDSQLLCEAALTNLTALLKKEKAVVTLSRLPVVDVDPDRLLQVFQNLIQNAVKFHREGVAAEVTVEGEVLPAGWLFRVSDNGRGIPEADQQKVFDVFERLRQVGPIEGSGVGMAVCKRMIEAHGGKIWVHPGRSEGTEICFTLPRLADPRSKA